MLARGLEETKHVARLALEPHLLTTPLSRLNRTVVPITKSCSARMDIFAPIGAMSKNARAIHPHEVLFCTMYYYGCQHYYTHRYYLFSMICAVESEERVPEAAIPPDQLQ